ncbi:hypothetical protein IKD82_00815 [Candidatus Saccharibacteria bacterium]|nr:hypothetical protein [Candidatus Saccharibacteria bacterium]
MARNFYATLEKIMKIAPEPLKDAIDSNISFWPPELLWYNLSKYVNKYVMKNSTDIKSVKIYAILCDCTVDEMLERFEKDGY